MAKSPSRPDRELGLTAKLRLAGRIWFWSVFTRLTLRIRGLPGLIAFLRGPDGSSDPVSRVDISAARLTGRRVFRALNVGPFRARCLICSLVLFRLLRRAGLPAEVVIGLREEARSHEAHAWVEVQRFDVGPPPGRGGHGELSRYS